jgi:DNA polymerase epsilon subunit 1
MRYQLQDIRCSKTNRVATSSLARVSECAAGFKLDVSHQKARSEIEILQHLAEDHELEELMEMTTGMLVSFK